MYECCSVGMGSFDNDDEYDEDVYGDDDYDDDNYDDGD